MNNKFELSVKKNKITLFCKNKIISLRLSSTFYFKPKIIKEKLKSEISWFFYFLWFKGWFVIII